MVGLKMTKKVWCKLKDFSAVMPHLVMKGYEAQNQSFTYSLLIGAVYKREEIGIEVYLVVIKILQK